MTREELENLEIDALDNRAEELRGMVDEPDADLDVIEKEVDAINEIRAAKISALEERKLEIAEVISGKGNEIEKETNNTMTNNEIRNTKEYIDAYAKYIRTGSDKECRALLTENATNGTIPVPVFVEDRVRTAWERDGITSRVRKTYLKGNIKVGFEISATGAVVHAEGAAAPSEETLVIGVINMVPETIKKWITISDEILDSSESFLDYVYDELTYQIAKKAAAELLAKIDACSTVSTNTPSVSVAVPVVAANTASLTLISECLSKLSDEAENPVIVMNKATYADFVAARAVANYAYDPFEGIPVVYNNSVKARSAATTGETWLYVGDFGHGAQFNFTAGEEIQFKYDDLSLAEKDLVKIVGRMPVAIGVTAPFAFAKVEAE